MDNPKLLCMGCMRMKQTPGVCPHCFFDLDKYVAQNAQKWPYRLQPQVVLKGKYMVGKALRGGDAEITYIGWDLDLEIPVKIKEYFPLELVTRDITKSNTVFLSYEDQEEIYLIGKKKFLDDAKAMASRGEDYDMVRDIFLENETVYVVTEYSRSRTAASKPSNLEQQNYQNQLDYEDWSVHQDKISSKGQQSYQSKPSYQGQLNNQKQAGRSNRSNYPTQRISVKHSEEQKSKQPVIIGLLVVMIVLFGIGGGLLFKLMLDDAKSNRVVNQETNQETTATTTQASDEADSKQAEEEENTKTAEEESTKKSTKDTKSTKKSTSVETNNKTTAKQNTAKNDYYIIPGSDSRYLNYNDIAGLSSWEIKLAKNEIYARYGRKFKNSDIQSHFDDQMWYSGTVSASNDSSIENKLNKYERENIEFLKKYEKKSNNSDDSNVSKGTSVTSDEDWAHYNAKSPYLIYGTDSRYIDYDDIAGLSKWEIKLAKNEIYAKHGRRFQNSKIQAYFDEQSWYVGTVSADDQTYVDGLLNKYERANVEFLQRYE